jgi:GlpG protein
MIPAYPVTGGVGLLALVVTLLWWNGHDVSFAFMSDLAFKTEPWRLVASALPHVNVFHLLFNLYMFWVFGSLVEEEFGHWKAAALYVFLAAVCSAAEYAFLRGGVGLSGVVYGLFGMLWVLSDCDEHFRGVVDRNTIVALTVWFFLCIVGTVTEIMRVANIAHGAGVVFGALIGLAIVFQDWRRWAAANGVVVLAILVGLAASVGRPHVNLSSASGELLAMQADEEITQGKNERAVRLYREALAYNPREARWWYNLGVAHHRLGEKEQALEAFERAVSFAPANQTYRKARDRLRQALGE